MNALLRIEDLWVEGRPHGGEYSPILNGVSISVSRGEVLALIGESGSGKSTTSLATLGYARPGCRITSGQVFLDGIDILTLTPEQKRGIRGNRVAYVAQSAAAAFNPALSIGYQVTESARIHRTMPLQKAHQQAVETFRQLGLPDPELLGRRYPHQVSGGQLQRMMAAMALSSGPELLVFDEPTSALDVTTQIEVLNAFKAVIQRQNAAAIYVSHDLAVVAQIADHV
ncbi:MAG: ATP-binding cassette domain-containing protein, partial [Proteobacteria bacterium]|nr:ATP-binding cassette domain-containing protein [Pseudomonadota bacterium]